MAKFAVGQSVDNAADDHESGTVVAVFPTVDDSFRYAVDMEGYGLLQFFAEEKLGVRLGKSRNRPVLEQCYASYKQRTLPRFPGKLNGPNGARRYPPSSYTYRGEWTDFPSSRRSGFQDRQVRRKPVIGRAKVRRH